ncbi:hypothetical protein BMS3Bbin02_00596 [bacterium BMS3Bbin02]|nr:hypothetical protein BMS3Bbin02_00596 [bacterium BMS3Bbin02]
MPRVTATAAFFGLRPVAKAFGWGESITKIRGMGMLLASARFPTMEYTSGSCSWVTGWALDDFKAILSEKKYMPMFNTAATPSMIIAPDCDPYAYPAATRSPPRKAIRSVVLRLFTMR